MKKVFKTLLVCIVSIVAIYLIFTLKLLFEVCEEYQIDLITGVHDLTELDADKIKKIGDETRQMESSIEEAKNDSNIQKHTLEDGCDEHSIGDFFDPLGYSVWTRMQAEAYRITHQYIGISVVLGISAAIAHAVITSKKINKIFKFLIGYFAIIVIVPPLYMYTWTFRFWQPTVMYFNSEAISFYIAYTIIFVLICIINYAISKKMAKDLNQAIKENKIEN